MQSRIRALGAEHAAWAKKCARSKEVQRQSETLNAAAELLLRRARAAPFGRASAGAPGRQKIEPKEGRISGCATLRGHALRGADGTDENKCVEYFALMMEDMTADGTMEVHDISGLDPPRMMTAELGVDDPALSPRGEVTKPEGWNDDEEVVAKPSKGSSVASSPARRPRCPSGGGRW